MAAITVSAAVQRLILNITYNHEPKGSWPNLLYGYPGPDYDAIYALVDGGYLTGPPREDVEAGRLYDVRYHLTDKARDWLTADPLSRLCRALREAPKWTVRLRDLTGDHDRDVIRQAHDAGVATVRYAGDGNECRVVDDYVFRHAQDFVVRMTEAARNRVLG